MSTEDCLFSTTVSFNFLCLNGFSKVHCADFCESRIKDGLRPVVRMELQYFQDKNH